MQSPSARRPSLELLPHTGDAGPCLLLNSFDKLLSCDRKLLHPFKVRLLLGLSGHIRLNSSLELRKLVLSNPLALLCLLKFFTDAGELWQGTQFLQQDTSFLQLGALSQMVQQKEEEMEQVKKDIQKLIDEGKVLHRQCAAATQGLDDEQMEIAQDFQRRPAIDLETEIESVAARLQISDGANQRVLGEYEDRANRIEQLRERLAAIDASLEQLETDIANIREQWEPRLDALVSQISDAFTDNFSKIQCAGEVVVHKDENFEQWALHLKVKFR